MKFLTALLLVVAFGLQLAAAEEKTPTPAEADAPQKADTPEVAPAEAAAAEEAPAEEAKPAPKPVLPLLLNCGQLIKITPETNVEMVDFDKLLAEGKLEVKPDEIPETITKKPDSGDVFAVAEIRLADKGKVSKTDFALRYGSDVTPCIALAGEVGGFDVRLWQVDKGTARLLFKVPAFTTAVSLEYAPQNMRIKLPGSPEIPFGEQPAEVAAPAPGEPAVTTPAQPVPTPVAEIKKPEPKPKPEPKKPEPKKPEPKKPEPKKEEPAGGGIPLF